MAITPPIATITIGQINSLLGIATGLVSISYVIWRWRHQAKRVRRRGIDL